MTQRDTILVIGATGAQGGSVARHLLASGRWNVRGLTRHPESAAARKLRDAGVEVIQGDLAERPSIQAALAGCRGVFGVTNFWEHFAGEYEHGHNLIDAVAASDVRHFIFSTLPSARRITHDEILVPHFDIKAQLEAEARERRIPGTFIHIAFYFENFIAFVPPRPASGGDGYVLSFPQGDTSLAGVGVRDVGGVVAELFARGESTIGDTVPVVGDLLPMPEYARLMSEALGVRVVYRHMDRDAYTALGFPGAAEVAAMFDYYRRFPPYDAADRDRTRELYPGTRDFAGWLTENAAALAQALPATV